MSGNVDSEFVGESKRQRIPLRTRNDGEYNDFAVRSFFFLADHGNSYPSNFLPMEGEV